jgi:hypothetical protein
LPAAEQCRGRELGEALPKDPKDVTLQHGVKYERLSFIFHSIHKSNPGLSFGRRLDGSTAGSAPPCASLVVVHAPPRLTRRTAPAPGCRRPRWAPGGTGSSWCRT